MRNKIDHIIELAKLMERASCSAEWFDSGIADNLRTATKAENELEEAVNAFIKEYDQSETT